MGFVVSAGSRSDLDRTASWELNVSIVRGLRYLYLAYLSQPQSERSIYRLIRRTKVTSVLEVGIGPARRATRMLEIAPLASRASLRYTGVDYFEARQIEHGEPLSIKEAYRQLKPTGAQIRLLPGDAYSVFSRSANSLGVFDLIVISAQFQDDALGRAWFYIPRMLHPKSQILLETTGANPKQTVFRLMRAEEIRELSQPQSRRKAA